MAAAVDSGRDAGPSPPTVGADGQDSSLADRSAASNGSKTTGSRRLTRKSSLTKDIAARRRVRRDSRIRFREGDQLTDSCPARTPWKDVVPPSCARILEMYRAACSKLKVRPLSQVVDFVQSIEDFTVRQEALSLKGVRLEPRHCEALEEVFRRVSVNILNLDSCGLEDDGALALMEMVEFYEGAFCLILSNNPKIQRATWLAMSRMMKRASFLHYIDLAQCTTDINSIPFLGRALRANCHLVTLHLERNTLSGPRLVILAAALKTNTNLAHLYLGENSLTAEDAVMLGAMLKGNRRLELLDIRDNHLLDQGVVLLCQALSCQEQGLKALVLWNNRFTTKAVPAMATMLALHRTLHTLEVGRNRLGNDGMDSLKQGLMRNRSIVRLGIMELGLTTTGTIALAEYIGESPVLETVNVRRNNIRLAGLLALARAHKLSQSLIRLDVDTSIKCDQQDQELLKDLVASLQEYSFRNQQLANERQLKESQEEARRREAEEENGTLDPPVAETSHEEDGDNVFEDTAAMSELGKGELVSSQASDEKQDAVMDASSADQTTATESQMAENGTATPVLEESEPELSPATAVVNHVPEGLLLRANHHHSIAEEDEEADNIAPVLEVDGDASEEALTSPEAEDSVMSFSSELEAALEELEPEQVDMDAAKPVEDDNLGLASGGSDILAPCDAAAAGQDTDCSPAASNDQLSGSELPEPSNLTADTDDADDDDVAAADCKMGESEAAAVDLPASGVAVPSELGAEGEPSSESESHVNDTNCGPA